MKKFAKILPYLIILFCVAFITLTLLKVDERADALTAQITALETENATLTEQLAAVTSELDAAKAAAIDSDLALAEANGRLEQAETALSDMLAVVQLIREELNGAAAEEEAVAEEEAPAEEVTEAVEAEEAVTEEVPAEEAAEEVTEAVENEEAVTEEVPAEETTDEAAAPEEAA
jgi:hypothetical protein